ncbi:hypothetical protein E5288_WYG016361 [Bos mutus]|uniref:Uncharacterized protein n=1 Tax=Bos mutus TaxID=72004 RepID=A0A6B0S9S9_9CETA|nr:hypothetical protein [Bos mutus]
MQKRCRAEAQAGLKPAWAPVQVLVDLCLKEDTLEQTLCYLLKKAKQEKPAAPVLPEAENLHHAHKEHKGDPEGGAAGFHPEPGGELHMEAGHAGQEEHPGPEFDGAGLALPLPSTGDPDERPPASSGDLPGCNRRPGCPLAQEVQHRGDKRHVPPPVSLKVGNKGAPEAGGAVMYGLNMSHVDLQVVEASGAGLAPELPPGLLDHVVWYHGTSAGQPVPQGGYPGPGPLLPAEEGQTEEEPTAPVLPEAEDHRHAHAEHQGDPEGGGVLCEPAHGLVLELASLAGALPGLHLLPRWSPAPGAQVPEDPSGDPVNHQLPDFRVRPDIPVAVPKCQPAEGPGPQWCQPDQPQVGAPAGPDQEDLGHPAGPGPGRVKHHGHPVQHPPALPELLLPAHHLQLLRQPHLHGHAGEPTAPHHGAERAEPCAVPCSPGEL